MTTRQQIKQKIVEKSNELEIVKQQNNDLKKKERSIHNELKILEAQARKFKVGIDVSDHAIVRFLERINDVDTSGIKNFIQSEIDKLPYLGDGIYPLPKGKAVVKDHTVVTIIE